MRNIEKYIPAALAFLENDKAKAEGKRLFFDKNGLAKGTYEGYIASFGTMVKLNGLLPAILVYADTSGNSDEKKSAVLVALLAVFSKNYNLETDTAVETLLNAVLKKPKNNILRKELTDISIALKLALRTFKMDKNNE